VGSVPVSLADSLLVVGISPANRPDLDLSALFFHRDLCHPAVSALRAAVSPKKWLITVSFKDYFYSRRRRIFGPMAILFLADIVDTMIKGTAYLQTLGVVYFVRSVSYIGLSIAAFKVKSERFHETFAIYATAFEILIILMYYMIIG
jgi:hypothetical protein